jgi:RHS repeat-associated protein
VIEGLWREYFDGFLKRICGELVECLSAVIQQAENRPERTHKSCSEKHVTLPGRKDKNQINELYRTWWIVINCGLLAVPPAAREYEAFGNLIPNSATGTWPGRFGYQGQAWQEIFSANASQRLLLSPTRLYDPVTGRFLQNEPMLANRPREHYAYARQSPLQFVDPTGLAPYSQCKIHMVTPRILPSAGFTQIRCEFRCRCKETPKSDPGVAHTHFITAPRGDETQQKLWDLDKYDEDAQILRCQLIVPQVLALGKCDDPDKCEKGKGGPSTQPSGATESDIRSYYYKWPRGYMPTQGVTLTDFGTAAVIGLAGAGAVVAGVAAAPELGGGGAAAELAPAAGGFLAGLLGWLSASGQAGARALGGGPR